MPPKKAAAAGGGGGGSKKAEQKKKEKVIEVSDIRCISLFTYSYQIFFFCSLYLLFILK